MSLEIMRGDITKLKVDAIVNTSNNLLCDDGGINSVNAAIYRGAGHKLRDACHRLNGCDIGEAKVTNGFRLPCRYVIHTVGPVWTDGKHGEEELLVSCYNKSLDIALERKCCTVAFPVISSGTGGYPKEDALQIAKYTIQNWLKNHDNMRIYLILYDPEYGSIHKNLSTDIGHYITKIHNTQNHIKELNIESRFDQTRYLCFISHLEASHTNLSGEVIDRVKKKGHFSENIVFEEIQNKLDAKSITFSETLFQLIDEKGLDEVKCYKKANINRKVFSKIRRPDYQPSKKTVLAFAGTMGLTMEEAKELLKSAGYAFSSSNTTDIIVMYFIEHHINDLEQINYALIDFGTSIL